jgi:hypothetical protein
MSELLYLITSLAAYGSRNALNKQFPSSRLKLITSQLHLKACLVHIKRNLNVAWDKRDFQLKAEMCIYHPEYGVVVWYGSSLYGPTEFHKLLRPVPLQGERN